MQYPAPLRGCDTGTSAQLRSAIRKIVMWLALLLIGILAIPTLLLLSLIGALWELADFTIRAIDS